MHNYEEFLLMDWPVEFRSREDFCVVLDWLKLFTSVDEVALRKEASNCSIASIGFLDCLEGSIKLCVDGS